MKRQMLFQYKGKLWARALLVVAAVLLVGQLAKLDADVSRRGDLFGSAAIGPGTTFLLNRTLALPNVLYDSDTQWCLIVKMPAAVTITNVEISCDADPTTELDWDLKFADTFLGLANATLIVAMDTTNGAASISSFTEANVPSGKAMYIEFAADPDADITQIGLHIEGDYD